MAPSNNLSFFIFVGVVIGYSIGFDSTLHLEVSPASFSSMMTDELDLTCITNDAPSNWVKKILTLEIMKVGEKPLAIITNEGVVEGPKWKDNVEAKGTINNNASINYLQLTIKKPKMDDSGTYACLMYYLDEVLQIKELKTEANVTVINEDITVVLKHLLEKISTLEKSDQDQKKLILDQKSTLQEQAILLNEYHKHTQDQVNQLEEKIHNQANQLEEKIHNQANQLEEKIHNQSTTLRAQDIILKLQNRSLQEQDKTLKEQNNTLKNIENTMEEHGRSIKEQNLIKKEQAITVKSQGERLQSQERELKEQRDWYFVHKREMDAQIKRLVSKQAQLQNENIKALEDIGHIQNLTNVFQDCMMEVKKDIKNVTTQDNKDMSPIAFSYGYIYNKYQKVERGQVLRFTDPITNFGGGYNSTTGIFTAPRDGLYVFHLVLRTDSKNVWIYITLRHNGLNVASLYPYITEHFDQQSASTIVYLRTGDVVKPLVENVSAGYVMDGSRFSVFSGFLLKPM